MRPRSFLTQNDARMFTFLVGGKHENVTFGEKQIVK